MKFSFDGINYIELPIKALDGFQIGFGIDYYGLNTDIPTGWLLCDGSAVSRTEYSELFAKIGTYYGSGDGSTTFNLPDMRERVGVGINPDDVTEQFDLIGKTGGSKELQNHTHRISTQSGNYPSSDFTNVGLMRSAADNYHLNIQTGESGSGDSGNMQPYTIICKIIKATNTTPTMASVVNATNDSTEDTYSCNYINWKLAGNTTSNGYIAIPSNATELHIMTRENDQMYTKNLMASDLVDGDYLYDGFYVSSANFGVCAWQYSLENGIHCLLLQRHGASKLGDSTTKIYYK